MGRLTKQRNRLYLYAGSVHIIDLSKCNIGWSYRDEFEKIIIREGREIREALLHSNGTCIVVELDGRKMKV